MPSASETPDERYRSFVAATMAKRIPLIIRNAGAGFDAEAGAKLEALAQAVEADAPMELDLRGWPFQGWDDLPARVNGLRPSAAPFFDFEYWMYARILQAVRYPERWSDPFRAVKHGGLDRHILWADEALARTTTLEAGLNLSLDANAHDLSQLSGPAQNHEFGRDSLRGAAEEVRRLNVITDNFGAEFVADLVLGIVAAEAGIEVVYHLKQLPIFVSDTTRDDIAALLDHLTADGIGRRLRKAISTGRLRFASHWFWAAPTFLDELPRDELGSGEGVLTVLKGDLNFRRAVGDVSVAIETPFQALDILPAAPILSLRSIKSYCVVGVTDWPQGVPARGFPMDGSIVAVQEIPAGG
jgi:hypothetical protein